jgi:hypothetical protein
MESDKKESYSWSGTPNYFATVGKGKSVLLNNFFAYAYSRAAAQRVHTTMLDSHSPICRWLGHQLELNSVIGLNGPTGLQFMFMLKRAELLLTQLM